MNAPIQATIHNMKPRTLNDNANPDPLPLGTTREIGYMRFHRYANSLQVTDLRNAGKRGKKVEQLYIQSQGSSFEDLDAPTVLYIVTVALRDPTIETVKRISETVATVNARELRGIDVTPAGQDIRITGAKIDVTFSPRNFTISDSLDFANESRAISLDDHGAKNATMAHKWALANRAEIAEMSFEGILRALRGAGVKYHRYCGMD